MAFTVPRWAKRIEVAIAGIVLFPLAIIAAFPWGPLVALGIRPLSDAFGREIRVGHARRLDWVSFVPMMELADVTVAQPDWAGPGTMARIARLRVRVPLLPLLLGRFRPHAIDVAGVTLDLRRDVNGRANWEGERRPGRRRMPLPLGHLTIAGGRLHLVDVRRHLVLAATLAADPEHGVVATGAGTHRGRPLRLAFHGGPLRDDAARPQAIRLAIRSPLASLDAAGRLDHPLDLAAFSARVRASGQDLTFLDDYLQAGLFATAPFALAGTVRRDGERWRLADVAGAVGRSRMRATLAVTHGARTRIDGRVAAATLDFDDFASAADRARGAARESAIGPRVIPATRIALDGLARLDGRVRLDVARLLPDDAPFRSLATVVTLHRRRLVLAPLTVGLRAGRMTGAATVDDRGAAPRLALDLRVTDATIQALFVPDGAVQGPFAARARLAGAGGTVRAALARADGTIGFSVPSGTIRRDYATYLGGDVLGSVGVAVAGGGRRVPLRCLVGRFRVTNGVSVPAFLMLDEALSRGEGTGRITFADERIDLALHGRPKRPGPLVSTAPVRVFGTMADPRFDIRPPRAEANGKTGAIARIGFFLKKVRTRGDVPHGAAAPDADCTGLARAALR